MLLRSRVSPSGLSVNSHGSGDWVSEYLLPRKMGCLENQYCLADVGSVNKHCLTMYVVSKRSFSHIDMSANIVVLLSEVSGTNNCIVEVIKQ